MTLPRLFLIMVLLFSATISLAREPMGKKASPRPKTEDKAQKQREAKREALWATISAQQKIIDRYERQRDSGEKPDPKQAVSEEEYDQAKAKRDAAQAELDALKR